MSTIETHRTKPDLENAAKQSFVTAEKAEKPLKMKAYGSIGHLPNSRMGPADHHVHEGQAIICTEKPRKGDLIIVSDMPIRLTHTVAKTY